MKLGRDGSLPFKLGGTKAPHTVAYETLRSALGDSVAAPGTLMESWRLAKARGLAACFQDKRGALQAFPITATAALPVYERLLAHSFPVGTPPQARRDALAVDWVSAHTAAAPDLAASLAAVDSRAAIQRPARAQTRETQYGRAFGDWDPNATLASGPAMNLAQQSTLFPNYADDFVLFLHVAAGATPSLYDRKQIELMKQVLQRVLPAWVDYRVFSTLGFVLDESQLDLTAFDT